MPEAHNILGVGPHCAAWLRRNYPHNRGKLIAREFKVHENTVWRWLTGVAPTTAHLEEMFAKWGRPWLEFVFVEAAERSDPRLSELESMQKSIVEEMEAIENEMRQLAARRAELRKAQEGVRDDRSAFMRIGAPRSLSPAEMRRAKLLKELTAEVPRGGIWSALTRLFSRQSNS